MSDTPEKFDPDRADGPLSPEAARLAESDAERREKDTELNIFDGVRGHDGGPILPVRLKAQDRFCFSCHSGVSCWNVCCKGADITLTPADILRLCRRLDETPAEFLERHTVPAIWDKADMPVAKLRMGDADNEGDGQGDCQFLDAVKGCTVYDDRPATCRYYPLGLAAVKMKGAAEKDSFHFLVKEAHCKGHEEDNLQSVAEFRAEQGVEAYDELNQGWIDVLMKLASWQTLGGPQGQEITAQTKRMFYMVATDVEKFRRFVFESKFLETYAVDSDLVEELKTDDELLLRLGFDWLKNVLFNEPTIEMREVVLQAAIAKTRTEMGAG